MLLIEVATLIHRGLFYQPITEDLNQEKNPDLWQIKYEAGLAI